MLGLRRATTTPTGRRPPRLAERPRPGASRPRAARRAPGLSAPALAVSVLVVAAGLSAWAPWREVEPVTLSDFSARVSASPIALSATAPAALAPVASAAPTQPAATPAQAAATAAPAVENLRPVGLPVQRNDWIILRDYVAHNGPGPNGAIDIGVMNEAEAIGTPIYATNDGVVHLLRDNKLYGNLVAVKNERWSTTYGHLDQILVEEGQTVRRGDIVGKMGKTGQASSPNVDYQVWEKVDGREVNRNPIDFIAPR